MEVNGYRQLFGYQQFLNILLCVQQKKEMYKDLNKWRVSKWWHDLLFWANYPILHGSDEMIKSYLS